VAAAVEAPVDGPLDAPAGRLEDGGHGQGATEGVGPTGPSMLRTRASTDPGARVAATASAAMAAEEAKAHRRQPGEGADPVGVSSSTRPSEARARSVTGA